MSHKANYITFSKKEPELPIFHQPWYLDALCGEDGWKLALVYRNQKIVASLPYMVRQKGPFRYITMPLLCRMLGPYLTAEFRTQRQEVKLYKELIERLPKVDYFEQSFHYGVSNWMPFYWQGYRQTTSYSYVLEPLDDLEKIYQGLDTDYRNNKIPKAQKQLRVVHDRPLEAFYEVHERSFRRQGISCPFSFEYLKRLDEALAKRQARQLFFAIDEQERIHSVAYVIWDQRAAYYLLAGDDPELRSSGGGILIAWEAIRYTCEVLQLPTFDFLGSMIQPIERVRRQFGARQQSYFKVRRYHSKLFQLFNWLKGRD
ncbi:MAG: GNAT family N-acetyltransferase [Bacteroidota bacterium]